MHIIHAQIYASLHLGDKSFAPAKRNAVEVYHLYSYTNLIDRPTIHTKQREVKEKKPPKKLKTFLMRNFQQRMHFKFAHN